MKAIRTGFKLLLAVILATGLNSCSKSDKSINIFSVDDDITLGEQIDKQITSDPATYPILDSVQYATAYSHLYRIRNTILKSGQLTYANRFAWKCRIIHSDTTVNAFCVSGGNIYVYSGIIKFLDNEAEFAGVLAHEMAHADRRHTTDMLTVKYGVDLLLGLLLGNNPDKLSELAANLAEGLGSLAYSRQNEYEADKYAVHYLYATSYDAASLGDFFTKINGESQALIFLSTHPSPADRLEKINAEFQLLGGAHGQVYADRYQQFKASLP
ncbi:MAG: M48 family metalloprotease [Bacteroidota bacterium]|nr:M48 family metalloprotease [Bacteroidota bacterium]